MPLLLQQCCWFGTATLLNCLLVAWGPQTISSFIASSSSFLFPFNFFTLLGQTAWSIQRAWMRESLDGSFVYASVQVYPFYDVVTHITLLCWIDLCNISIIWWSSACCRSCPGQLTIFDQSSIWANLAQAKRLCGAFCTLAQRNGAVVFEQRWKWDRSFRA